MGPASAGARIVSHYQNGKGGSHFRWWEDGECRTSFEWPRERLGSTPDELVDAMTRVGFDLEADGEDPGVAGKAALAEDLTGVRVTADFLAHASYLTGYVGSPGEGGESPRSVMRGSSGRGSAS